MLNTVLEGPIEGSDPQKEAHLDGEMGLPDVISVSVDIQASVASAIELSPEQDTFITKLKARYASNVELQSSSHTL